MNICINIETDKVISVVIHLYAIYMSICISTSSICKGMSADSLKMALKQDVLIDVLNLSCAIVEDFVRRLTSTYGSAKPLSSMGGRSQTSTMVTCKRLRSSE